MLLMLCILLAGALPASAERSQQSAVYELYSADGYYVDEVGNEGIYSYHVPQIHASTAAAEEINAEIAERFGERVEAQLRNMEGGYSVWSGYVAWKAYWNGTQLFLFLTADENGDANYGAYGYDFETGSRITNEMILEQKGISEEEYLEKLKERVQLLFEEKFSQVSQGFREKADLDAMLEKTLSWADMEQPMFIDQFGEITTIVKIYSLAGGGWYYRLARPFSDPSDKTYQIRLVGDSGMVEFCPETAKEGETVTVRLYDVDDGEVKIHVSGADGTRVNWFEYQFVMPDHDVDVRIELIGNGLA